MSRPGAAVRKRRWRNAAATEERCLAQEVGRREHGELEVPEDRDRNGGRDAHVPDEEDQPLGEAIPPVTSSLRAMLRLTSRDVGGRPVSHSASCRLINSANMTNQSSYRKVVRDFRHLSQWVCVLDDSLHFSAAPRSHRPTHPESNAEFGAQIADPGFGLVHGSHGQAQLGGGHLIGPATIAATGAGGGHARFGPLDD